MISFLVSSLAILSLVLNLWQWFAARRFPLHRKGAPISSPFPITCLKPLKGEDSQTNACLSSWFEQKYPAPIQILFGVATPDDPVVPRVRELIKKYPSLSAQLLVCAPLLGPNAKVSTLCHLLKKADYEHLVISDADVWIEPDFLAHVAGDLNQPNVGLVNCFYELANPKNLPMKWEGLAVNADFWSQVLQGISLKPMDFALGAVMATRRSNLEKIGGFEGLVDYLADDYWLGNRIAATGSSLSLCPLPVQCRSDAMTWGEVWRHQLRWARTIRVCQPLPYFFSILSNATFWPLLWVAVSPSTIATLFFPVAIALRLATAADNYHRLLKRKGEPNPFWFAPLKDILQVAIWALSFTGNKIQWRGNTFCVGKGGKLTPVAS